MQKAESAQKWKEIIEKLNLGQLELLDKFMTGIETVSAEKVAAGLKESEAKTVNYNENSTMRLIGRQNYSVLVPELKEIEKAHGRSMEGIDYDVYILGYITGKRAERARRRAHGQRR